MRRGRRRARGNRRARRRRRDDDGSGFAGGCEAVEAPEPKPDGGAGGADRALDASKTYELVVETNCGSFTIELDQETAPKTAASLVSLAENGFFDGTTFHRVVPGFVIQGGDPTGTGTGGPGYKTVDVPPPDAAYTKGVVAMAKAGFEAPGHVGQPVLRRHRRRRGPAAEYAVVGKVTEGIETVAAIDSARRRRRAAVAARRDRAGHGPRRPDRSGRPRRRCGDAVRRAEAAPAAPRRPRAADRRRPGRRRRRGVPARGRGRLPGLGARARRLAPLRARGARRRRRGGRGRPGGRPRARAGRDRARRSRPGGRAAPRSSRRATAACAAIRSSSPARPGTTSRTRGCAAYEPLLVPCDDLGAPGDVDVPDDLPERFRRTPDEPM